MNVCVAMVMVPLREDVLFVATEKLTVPLPLPLEPAVTFSQEVSLLTAVHGQFVPAVTVMVPDPPLGVNVWLVGEIV